MARQPILPDAILGPQVGCQPLPALRVALTRFNMVLPGFREAGGLMTELQFERWLRHRLRLFTAICLRSLVVQTRPFDAWLLGFDAARRAQVEPVLNAIAPHPWIVPVWQERKNGEPENARAVFLRAIGERLRPEHEWIISTRVDNDDALHRHFAEAVAHYAAAVVPARPGLDDFWISFPLGAQFGGGALRLMPQNNNAFLSRVERVAALPPGGAGTALQGNHGHVFARGQVFTPVTNEPMWLQVAHGANLRNRTKERLMRLADPQPLLILFNQRLEVLEYWCPAAPPAEPAAQGLPATPP